MALLRVGLNHFDSRSVDAVEADVRRAEPPGSDVARRPDPRVQRRVRSPGRRASENRLHVAYDRGA